MPNPIPGAVRRKLPATQSPQLCTLAEDPPEGDGWLSEIKFDGYRLIARLDHGEVRLLTRNGLDWAARLPTLRAAIARLQVETAMLDGELVALLPDGTSSFSTLQAAIQTKLERSLHFYAFDLLHLDGQDLRGCALLDRKRALQPLLMPQGVLRYSDHHVGQVPELRRNACRMKLEGIVCKRADAPYRAGRGGDWLKLKCLDREEFIVLGWTPPSGSRAGIGALQMGYFDPDGGLHFAGGVGTGFSDTELRHIRNLLDTRAAAAPKGLLVTDEPVDRAARWVRPDLVAEINFSGWTGGGRLRHGVFLGLREDKAVEEVVRTVAAPAARRTAFRAR